MLAVAYNMITMSLDHIISRYFFTSYVQFEMEQSMLGSDIHIVKIICIVLVRLAETKMQIC